MRKNLDNGLLHAMSALVRVVDAGSFTAAGAQMHLTTAQISRLVSELENRLQSKLLHRTTRKLALTSVGEQYVKDARTILDLVAQAENNVAGISTQPAGRLRVMCMTSFGNRYVVPLVPKFCARFPRVNLEYSASQYVPDLLAGGVDVSVYLSQHLPDSGMIAQRLGVTSAVLCAAPKYLAAQGVPKMPRELAGHACLRLLNPSISSNWELSDGKTLEILSPIGPVLGDIPEVVLQGALGRPGHRPAAALQRGRRAQARHPGARAAALAIARDRGVPADAFTAFRRREDARMGGIAEAGDSGRAGQGCGVFRGCAAEGEKQDQGLNRRSDAAARRELCLPPRQTSSTTSSRRFHRQAESRG